MEFAWRSYGDTAGVISGEVLLRQAHRRRAVANGRRNSLDRPPNRRPRSSRSACTTPASSSITNRTGCALTILPAVLSRSRVGARRTRML